ncbi:MAG: O-antigen ligase family protein [Lachnospiraceae bacterium]|nr:O-antigen ligase family protein [Lachnospiraceae bacterium]
MSLGGVGISILGIALHKRIQEIFYVSVVSRIQIMQGMVAAILEKPIFGNGVNSVGFFTYDSHLGHNIYLQMWVEQGIIGLVVLLFMLFFPLFLTLKRIRRQNPGFKVNNTNYYFSLFMQIFVIVYGFSGNPLYDYNIIITYFLALSSGMSKG